MNACSENTNSLESATTRAWAEMHSRRRLRLMPELPEVERVRKIMESVLLGQEIKVAEVVEDEIVLGGQPAESYVAALQGRTVTGVGRKGKFWWIEFEEAPIVFGHLGMSGWIRELGNDDFRLKEHGEAPLLDENGRPRFLKMMLSAANGRTVALTDGRRLARLWLGDSADTDGRVKKLGRDCYLEPLTTDEISRIFTKKKAPLKAVLLDQAIFAGIGNWLADEIMFQAGIAPKRPVNTLSLAEIESLRIKMIDILELSVRTGADYEQFPENWMFHARWGGSKGAETIGGHPIIREQVGGRTTAWVPTLQK